MTHRGKLSKTVGLPVTFSISCIGTITNAISISFFLKRKSGNIGDKFLVFLNSVDITICMYSLTAMVLTLNPDGEDQSLPRENFHFWFWSIFQMLVELSGIGTCFLSLLRAISISWPLHQIDRRKVYASFILAVTYFISIKFTMKRHIIWTMVFVNATLMIVLVIVCSIISVKALQRTRPEIAGQGSDGNEKATKMVLILSLLFVTFNTVWALILAYHIATGSDEVADDMEKESGVLNMITYIIASTNSAFNPIVYMTRNEEMNKYVKGALGKVSNVICKPCLSETLPVREELDLSIVSNDT